MAGVWLVLPFAGVASTIDVTVADGLADAMADASPGDVLILECGTYLEQGIVVVPGVIVRSETGGPGCVTLETPGLEPVLIIRDAGMDTRLEGLVFSRSTADTSGAIVRGGGVLCDASSPVFQRCEFRDLAAAYGGAVFCGAGSSPTFQDCVFQDNQAWAAGGAIACVDDSSPALTGCLLAGNSAAASGGAIHAAAGSSPGLFSCTLADNHSPTGSGLSSWDAAAVTADKVILAGGGVGAGWTGDSASEPVFGCSDLFGNDGGDWAGALADQEGMAGNLSADPVFCAGAGTSGYYSLDGNSPCAPSNSGCGLVGALPIGCWGASHAPDDQLPTVSRMRGGFPNPFNPRTTIAFDIGREGRATLAVYDLAGRLVQTLVDESLPRGSHEATWEGCDSADRPAAAGVYLLRLKTADAVSTRRVTLIK